MSTLEKFFVQIFERKEQIIEQIQQQADSYTQQLASTLLIDGITPPSWLLNPNSSNSNELEKEDIISKLLLRPTRDSVAYSRGNCSLYSQPVVAGNDGQLWKETCVETTSPNKGLHISDELMKTLECENNETFECPDKDKGYSLSCAAEKDDGIISPQNETDARISSIYSAPDMSLVRIQRSRSRQKARELRTSGKATVKSCLGNENRTDIFISGDLKSDTRHVLQDKRPSEVDKCNDMSGETSIAAEGKVEKGNDRTSHSSRLAKSSSPNEIPSYVNDPSKNSSSFEKDELDGINQVQAIGNILQQPGHSDGVMKGGKHPEVCLGSSASRKSITEKTQDAQRHNKAFWGRITRSRSSIQQTSGMGTSDSCIPKECGGALPQFVSNKMYGLDAANKLPDAVETSQVLNDRIRESQAVSRNEGVLKQVNSSNVVGARVTRSRSVPMNESQVAANHQESANVVVGNGPREAPVVIQPVSSVIKLDAVTLCTESEGLASRQSPDCSMAVKPKQLNFDEIDECDLNEVCSPLSKKRRLDGLSRDEFYPSTESASSLDYKSSGNFFKQQLPETNVLSNSPIAAMTHFHNKIESAKDETLNIGLDKNEKPMVEAFEHNSKVSLHDNIDVICEIDTSPKEVHNILDEEKHSEKSHLSEDRTSLPAMQIEEGVLGHKGERTVAGDASFSFISNLTKQNEDSKDCLDNEVRIPEKDLGSSKSKEFDVGTNLKLSNVKLNSAEFNTWPENQQRNIEDQPNCFSDSRGYRVHIQRDAIHCDLEATENDLNSVKESASVLPSEEMHVSLSDGIPICDRRVCDDMMCDLPEGTESLHKLQAAEANATEVGDDTTETTYTPKHSSPTRISNLIRNAAEDSTCSLVVDMDPTNSSSIDDVITDSKKSEISFSEWVSSFASFQSSQTDDKSVIVSDEIMPVYEGFIIDQVENASMENAEGGIDFHALEIPSTTIARARIIEQICKSATMEAPLSQFSSKLMQPQVQDMYGFMADGTLEQMDLASIVSLDEDSKKHLQTSDSDFNEICRAFQNEQQFDSVPLAASPYYWQSKSHYLSPVGKFWERSASSSGSSEKQLSSNPELTCFPIEEDPRSDEESEQRENDDEMAIEKEPPPEANEICSQHANPVSASKKYPDRCSSNSVNIELSVPRTRDNVKYKPKNHPGIKISRYGEDIRTSSIATRASSRGNVSEYSKAKSSLRSGIPRVSQKEDKRNNIVSNITSFIPMVQQKQAATVCTGKRDIKVKALEAAEAAKRREQEKENERKMKKEALKLERARIGKENAREMELDKKKKQDALKKKEADMAARKRQREEEEKKQVAKKRKLVAEAQKTQKLQFEKSRFGKVELEKQQNKNAAIAGNKKGSENLRQTKNADENSSQRHTTELKTDKALASVIQQVASVPEKRDASFDCGEKEKTTSVLKNTPVKVESVKLTSQESSYDISPYQCSDDEDDEEDDLPTKKFVPSWASKSRVAMVLPLQQSLNPETIFPVESFCSMDEVLLPRRIQQAQ